MRWKFQSLRSGLTLRSCLWSTPTGDEAGSSLFTPKATGGVSGGLGEEELTAEVWFVSFVLPKPRPLLLRRRLKQQPRVLIPVREAWRVTSAV